MPCSVEKFSKIECLHVLICRRRIGNIAELARRLNLSQGGLDDYLGDLRCLVAEMFFCSQRGCYYYMKPFRFLTIRAQRIVPPKPHDENFFGHCKNVAVVGMIFEV